MVSRAEVAAGFFYAALEQCGWLEVKRDLRTRLSGGGAKRRSEIAAHLFVSNCRARVALRVCARAFAVPIPSLRLAGIPAWRAIVNARCRAV
jgi:hypothetical protein